MSLTGPGSDRIDENFLLHHGRTAHLRTMPPGARRLLSAGCAGLWYFDWIADSYGRVDEHLGIEFYSPRPEGLPSNVRWIANTASDMSGVESASCDLIFSGQNIEHLWPNEQAGFLLEAARVSRPGGYLVIDAPNREITKGLTWVHPEHTVEFTPGEAARLVSLAGFDVFKLAGIYVCRDPRTLRLLPYDPNTPDQWTVVERLAAAQDLPEHAFLWWIEARRSYRPPDAAAIRQQVDLIFQQAWPERMNRMVLPAERRTEQRADGEWVISEAGQGGTVVFGPYAPLPAGRYSVEFSFDAPGRAVEPCAVCDIVWGHDGALIQRQELAPGQTSLRMEFSLDQLHFGVQFRCFSQGRERFTVRRRVEFRDENGAVNALARRA